MVAGWPAPGRGLSDEDSTPASLRDVAEWAAEAPRSACESGLTADDAARGQVMAAGLWLVAAASDTARRRPLQTLGITPRAIAALRSAAGAEGRVE
eukprot:15464548-Alexandrium_andersonii.AAC.1